MLNSAAGHLQRTGRFARARELYQRAIAGDAKSKVLWLNLAVSCRSLGDTGAESQALDKALALEPRYVAALLQKADLMERLGKPMKAVITFEAAPGVDPTGRAHSSTYGGRRRSRA